jgi:hypothetical protein
MRIACQVGYSDCRNFLFFRKFWIGKKRVFEHFRKGVFLISFSAYVSKKFKNGPTWSRKVFFLERGHIWYLQH